MIVMMAWKLLVTINAKCKNVKIDTENYNTHIDLEVTMESVSDTRQHLLECVSPTFYNSLYSALIGNIVTSIVQNRTTRLQLAIGILFRQSKSHLNHLHKYKVMCTHDEMLRFKKSAAVNSANNSYLQGVPKMNSLFQAITDNYDAKMHSQNNKLLCHCLATILTKNEDSMLPKTSFPPGNLQCHHFQNTRLMKNSRKCEVCCAHAENIDS